VRRQELEKTLRGFEPLKGVSVHYPDTFKHAMLPTLVCVQGLVSIKGEMHMYEMEIDLRSIQTREDVHALVSAIFTSFEKAEKHPPAGGEA
jgi:hypothetical protein